jgi:hypothetical protein
LDLLNQIGWGLERHLQKWPLGASIPLSLPLNVAANGHHGVGGEGEAPPRVEAEQRAPESDAPRLQGFFVGEWGTVQPLEDPVDQRFILPNQVVHTVGATVLGVLELTGMKRWWMFQLC